MAGGYALVPGPGKGFILIAGPGATRDVLVDLLYGVLDPRVRYR